MRYKQQATGAKKRKESNGTRRYLIDKKQPVNVSDDDIYNNIDEDVWITRKID